MLFIGSPTLLVAQDTGDNENTSDNTSYGTTSAEFLLLGASARGAALGTSFAAIANDVSALYYNPAGIALQRSSGFSASAYDYVANTNYAWAGLSFPFGGGLSYQTASKFSLGLDYAYKYMGTLGPTNFFTFSVGF